MKKCSEILEFAKIEIDIERVQKSVGFIKKERAYSCFLRSVFFHGGKMNDRVEKHPYQILFGTIDLILIF